MVSRSRALKFVIGNALLSSLDVYLSLHIMISNAMKASPVPKSRPAGLIFHALYRNHKKSSRPENAVV